VRQRCADWTTHECVEGGLLDGGSGSGPDDPPEFNAPTGATDDQIDQAVVLASDILFGLTKWLYTGACGPRVFRPCRKRSNGWPAWPALGIEQRANFNRAAGGWWDWWTWQASWGTCTCDSNPCGCGAISRISLGVYPLLNITEITIDGDVLDPAAYVAPIEHNWLDRVDGHPWPMCQNPDAPLTDDNTFGVEATWGIEVPEGGAVAACYYARQIALGLAGEPCELPSKVRSIVRQGTTMTFADQTELVAKGLTGVDLVDQWIRSVNGETGPEHPATFIIPGVQSQRAQLSRRTP
jgi:hypothetical protein